MYELYTIDGDGRMPVCIVFVLNVCTTKNILGCVVVNLSVEFKIG